LARSRADNPIAVGGIEASLVAPLPIGLALQLDPATVHSLSRLGLRRVGDLLERPRGPLARRYGKGLLDQLDVLVGRRPITLRPVAPPPDFSVAREPLEPIITRGGIDFVVDDLLGQLCVRLRQDSLGLRQLTLMAFRVDGAVKTVEVGTGQPTNNPAHLRRLFAEKLGKLEPDLGFERMPLEAQGRDRAAAWPVVHHGCGNAGTRAGPGRKRGHHLDVTAAAGPGARLSTAAAATQRVAGRSGARFRRGGSWRPPGADGLR
jgi:protein ImuB